MHWSRLPLLIALALCACGKRDRQPSIRPTPVAERSAAPPDAKPPITGVMVAHGLCAPIGFAAPDALIAWIGEEVVRIELIEPFPKVVVAKPLLAIEIAARGNTVAWINWDAEHAAPTAELWISELPGKVRKLATFKGPAGLEGLAADGSAVYAVRGWPEYSITSPRDRDLVSFSIRDGSAHVLVGHGAPNKFAADETHVYWTEGMSGGTIRRKPKTGGTEDVVASAPQGHIYVVGDSVLHASYNDDLSLVPKSGGTLHAIAGLKMEARSIVADDLGFCGMQLRDQHYPSSEGRVVCRSIDGVVHEIRGAVEGVRYRSLAIDHGHVAFVAEPASLDADAHDQACWVVPRP